MPRRLIWVNSSLQNTSNPPSGYKMIGYDGDFLSQKDSTGSISGIVGCKKYVALLDQSGGDNPQTASNGSLVVGTSYEIYDYQPGDDFTNVGASSNATGVKFAATGTLPNNWTNGSTVLWNTGAPQVKVLENSLGNIWFGRDDVGLYSGILTGAFVDGKTTMVFGNNPNNVSYANGDMSVFGSNFTYPDSFFLSSGRVDGDGNRDAYDSILQSAFLEIRVYP